MAAELDALSLNITASSRDAEDKIQRLIDKLSTLNNAFKSLTGSTTYATNIETAVHSITRLNNAISNIDAAKISAVAKSMKDLGRAGGMLSNFGNISKVGQAMDSVSSRANDMAKNIANSFSIKDKQAIDSMTSSIETMMKTMGKGDDFYAAEHNITQIIQDFGKFENVLDGTIDSYNRVRDILRSTKLYIPENFSSEADWLKNRATLGIRNTTSDKSAGISVSTLKGELEGIITELQGIDNEADIINKIAEWLRGNATPAAVDFATAMEKSDEPFYKVSDAVDTLERSLGIIVPTLEEIKQFRMDFDVGELQTLDEMLAATEEGLQRWRDSMQTATTAAQSMGESIQTTANQAQPFEQIVMGLESLQGVTIGDFSNITVLAEGVNKLGYQSSVTAAQILPQIAEGLAGFDFQLPNMTGMEEFTKGIRSLGSKAVQNAAYSLPFVADGLKQLSGIKLPEMTNLTEFAQALSIFGRQTSERAVANIPKLAQAFEQLFRALSKAPTISRNTIDAANAMANLASRTGSVTTALRGANAGITSWTRNAGRATKSTFSLASAIGKVYATYWMLFRAFGMIGKAINVASDMTEVKNVVVQAFGDMAYKANEFARVAGESFGMSRLEALDAASRYQAMGKTMGITNQAVAKSNDFLRDKLKDTLSIKEVQKAYGDLGNTAADMSINLTKLAGDLASLYNTDIEVAAEKLNSIFTGTTKPLREFGFDLTQATLQEWAMKNGIDANVKSMTQAEKAILRYQYVMANASFVMGDFVRTADSWHNTIVSMKLAFQNLGNVIGQGFINLLKPAIQKITTFVNTLTKLVEKAINAIGKLLGWQVTIEPVKPSTDLSGGENEADKDMSDGAGGAGKAAEDAADATEDADKAAEDYADNMDKAQKAAKKMKDYLLGIDELNVFQPDDAEDAADKTKKNKDKANKDKADKDKSGSGSGAGAGSGGDEGGATGGNVSVSKYASDISSWFQLGDKIGDALSKAMEGIDWKKIYKKAEHFGTGLASFLNGLITPRLFENVGKTIANSLNTALHFLDSFGKHFDWKNFGASIAAGINGFFKNFDFKLLASVLNTWALGLLDTLIVALRKTDWEMIGRKIGEFLVNIKWLAIGKKVAQAIWEAINAAFKAYKGMFKAAPLETAILSVVAAFKLFYDLKTAAWFKNLTKVVGVFNTELAKGNGVIAATNVAFPIMGSLLTRIVQVFKIGASSIGEFASSLSMGQGFMNASILGFSTLKTGVNAFAASLSPVAKLIGGVGAALVEFMTVSDGMKNIVTGAQSLKTSLAELVLGVTAAGAAFTLVFGFPAGLIATAVVGVVAAIKGVNDAFNEIKAEDFGNKIKNALTNPGGTPLEDVIGGTIESLSNMGSEFEALAADSEKLNSVDGNIRDIETEISLLELQLANGVITQEEYTAQVSDAYARMSSAIQTKVGEAELYIAGALGEGSPIAQALEQEGVNVKKVADDAILKGDELLQRATEITTQLAALDPNSQEYRNLKQELMELVTQEDATSQASQALETSLQKNLDWEKFIDADTGQLQVDTIKGALGEVVSKVENVQTAAEESMNGVVTSLKNAGNEAGADEVQNAIPGALENINGKISEKCTEMSDTIQRDAIDKITEVINTAGDTWENLDDWEKAIYDYNKSEYQKQAAESYKTSIIDPLSQSIEEEYGQLGIDGAGWAEAASSEILKGIFSESVVGNEDGWQTYITSLSTNWQDAVKQGSELTYDTAVENGKYIGMGIGEGMKETDTDTPISNFFRKLWDSFASKFQSHSPAKAMYPMGENIMAGVIEGFKQKYADISKTISDWFEKYVKPWFTVEKWKTLGTNMATAIITKWNEFKTQWTSSINNWWTQNVVPWFNLDKWKAEADHLREAIITKFNDMVTQWRTDIEKWWNEYVVAKFELGKWKAEADHLREAIISKLTEMVSEWHTKIESWWKEHVLKYFDAQTWIDFGENIKKGILGGIEAVAKEWKGKLEDLMKTFDEVFKDSTFKEIGKKAIDSILAGFKEAWSGVTSWVEEKVNWLKDKFTIKAKVETDNSDSGNGDSDSGKKNDTSKKVKKTTKATGGIFSDGRWRNVHAYGSGSTDIDNGQLFWAREKGPELVGTIGGNTAVVNNDQIVASVAAGVQQAVTEALTPYLSDISTNTRVTANKDFTVQIGDRQIAEANNRGQRSIGAVLFT